MQPRLYLFSRFPEAGRVKTRLIPALGPEGAAALHRRLVLRTLRTALAARNARPLEVELQFTGGTAESLRHWLGNPCPFREQAAGDLGRRMAAAMQGAFDEGRTAALIVGTDCPGLTTAHISRALDALKERPVVFGPAHDGGYYMIGLTRPMPELFHGIAWGTDQVLAQSLGVLRRAGVEPALLDPLDDLDRPEDLPGWKTIIDAEESDHGKVSVIIPALNEAGRIAATVQAAQEGGAHEVIVVDGGSQDMTPGHAESAGATVMGSAPGRAGQMNAGAAQATGTVLLFLHADTLLPADWVRGVKGLMTRPEVAAGAFQFRVDGDFPGRRFIEWTTRFRSRRLGLPYGDQGLFMRRRLFEELGGYASLPIMEDYELVRRLARRGRIVTVDESIRTSARRWKELGVLRTTLVNQAMIVGYHLGVSPGKLAGFYRTIRPRR